MSLLLISDYLKWYESNFKIIEAGYSKSGKIFEVFPPCYDKNNASFSFYLQEKVDKIVVTDLGFTIGEMKASEITKTKIENIKEICIHNEVNFNEKDNELFFEVYKKDENYKEELNKKLQGFIYALIEVDSLKKVLEKTNIQKLFLEQIIDEFSKKKVSFNSKPKALKGAFADHDFDISVKKVGLETIYIKVYSSFENKYQKDMVLKKLDLEKADLTKNNLMQVFCHDEIKDSKIIRSLTNSGVEIISKDKLLSTDFIEKRYLNYMI